LEGSETLRKVHLQPPKHGGSYVIAHRGAHQSIPANTLPAYQKAIELGVDFVEVDIRTTSDGEFVSVHDSAIDTHAAGSRVAVRDLTLQELKSVDIGRGSGDERKGVRIPTFEEILDLCHGSCGIWLDLKDARIPPLAEMVIERGMEHEVLWCIGPSEVEELREACPECIEMPDPGRPAELPRILAEVRPCMVSPVWHDLSKEVVDVCHAAGVLVFADERDPGSWVQAIEWGVDGIQTDYPAELIEFLEGGASCSPDSG
jgi:glycerophosphoryl diester phosphodiesterase